MKLAKASIVFCSGLILMAAASISSAKTVTIRWTDHERNSKQVVDAIISDFESLNPGIKVKFQPMNGWEIDKIITMITANSAPDVMWTFGEHLANLTEKGLMVDFSKYLKTAGLQKNLDNMSPTLVKNFWVGKRLIAIPKYAGTHALAYNKVIFEKAGVAAPTSDWNWDDIIAVGQKLVKRDAATARTTQFGYSFPTADIMQTFIYQNGGEVIPSGELMGSKLLINSPKAMDALKFAHSLIWKYRIAPTPSQADTGVFGFLDRKIAMASVASWDVDLFKTFKDEWNIVELPKGPQGERASYHGLDGYVIPRNTRHLTEALKFLAYLTSERGERLRMKAQPLQPANRSVSKEWEAIVHSIPKNAKLDTQVYLKSMNYAYRPYLLKHHALVVPVIQSYLSKIFDKNTMALENGIESMVREVNAKASRK